MKHVDMLRGPFTHHIMVPTALCIDQISIVIVVVIFIVLCVTMFIFYLHHSTSLFGDGVGCIWFWYSVSLLLITVPIMYRYTVPVVNREPIDYPAFWNNGLEGNNSQAHLHIWVVGWDEAQRVLCDFTDPPGRL